MAYDDARFISRQGQSQAIAAYNGTFTASDHVATEAGIYRIPLARACKLLGGTFVVTTAGASKVPKVCVMQSTTTGCVINPSHTSGAVASGTLSNTVTFTAGEVALINLLHTGTASAAQAFPAGTVHLDLQDQYS